MARRPPDRADRPTVNHGRLSAFAASPAASDVQQKSIRVSFALLVWWCCNNSFPVLERRVRARCENGSLPWHQSKVRRKSKLCTHLCELRGIITIKYTFMQRRGGCYVSKSAEVV